MGVPYWIPGTIAGLMFILASVNSVSVFEILLSDVADVPLSRTSRFSRRDRWIDIENINVEPQPLMSIILIHNIRKV